MYLFPSAKQTEERRTASGHHRRIRTQLHEPLFQPSELRELLENYCFKIVNSGPVPKLAPGPGLETNYFILL